MVMAQSTEMAKASSCAAEYTLHAQLPTGTQPVYTYTNKLNTPLPTLYLRKLSLPSLWGRQIEFWPVWLELWRGCRVAGNTV